MDKRLQGVLTSGYGFQLLSHKVECQSPRPILECQSVVGYLILNAGQVAVYSP